jgi:hypothetical protein
VCIFRRTYPWDFLRMIIIPVKLAEEIKTCVLCSITFVPKTFLESIMSKNIQKSDRPQKTT